MHEYVSKFDKSLSAAVNLIPASLNSVMNIISFLGLPIVIIALATSLAVVSWVRDAHRIAIASAFTLLALAGNTGIKYLVHRPRPDTIYVENMVIHSYSFPSGHAFGSAVFYGLIAYIVFTYAPQPWNIIGAILLGLLIFMIGLSRVYLGAHFPSDVIIGWILGSLSLLVIIKIVKP